MFGLSLTKIILIALVAAALWYGLRAYRHYAARRLAAAQQRDLRTGAESMVQCPVCGTYNPPGVTCSHRS